MLVPVCSRNESIWWSSVVAVLFLARLLDLVWGDCVQFHAQRLRLTKLSVSLFEVNAHYGVVGG